MVHLNFYQLRFHEIFHIFISIQLMFMIEYFKFAFKNSFHPRIVAPLLLLSRYINVIPESQYIH